MSPGAPGDRSEAPTLPSLPADESARLDSLRHYDILDTAPEQAYDDLTMLAAHVCDTPIALVTFVDAERQWFKARHGLDISETPRDVAFCSHAIAGDGIMVVPDATRDERFSQNPLVTDQPQIRFYAGVPLRVSQGHALGTLCVIDRRPRELTGAQLGALEALSRQVSAQLELRLNVAQLEKSSVRDPLTAVFNRRYFDTMLPKELARAERYEDLTSLLFVDVDHFKQVNDRFGHQEGDRVLATLSATLTRSTRAADVVCRYGGEEFAIILPHTGLSVATQLADRIRERVARETAQATPPLKGGGITVTIGVTTFPAEARDAVSLVALADQRLYVGKASGRNRVVAQDA